MADPGRDMSLRRAVRALLKSLPNPDSVSDHEIARTIRGDMDRSCSRNTVKSVRLELMHAKLIPGGPWWKYIPYGTASGGNRWLPNGSMIGIEEFQRMLARGECPGFDPNRISGDEPDGDL